MVTQYLKAILKDAWKPTWKRFADTWTGYVVIIVSFVIGVCLHAEYAGWTAASDNAVVTILFGLGGTVGAMVLYFLWKCVSAPYRFWKMGAKGRTDRVSQQEHSRIAKELEVHIQKGYTLHRGFSLLGTDVDVPAWRKEAEAIVAKCGAGELAMLRTLFPPQAADANDVLAGFDGGIGEREILSGSINKLRNIMARQLALSNEQLTED